MTDARTTSEEAGLTNAQLKQLLEPYFDEPAVESFSRMTQGKENWIYVVNGDFGVVVVRIWGDHSSMGWRLESDINGELDLMEACNNAGVPTPTLFRSKNGNRYEYTPQGRWYAVTSYVPGESPSSFDADMAVQIASEMAKMHMVAAKFSFPAKRSYPGTLVERTESKIASLSPASSDEQLQLDDLISEYSELLAKADLTQLPTGAIHGDIMRENIKFDNGRLSGIFDFDDCRESYFVEDIAKSLIFEFQSPELCIFGERGANAEAFLRAYEASRPLTTSEHQLLPLICMSYFVYQAIRSYNSTDLATHLRRYRDNEAFFRPGL